MDTEMTFPSKQACLDGCLFLSYLDEDAIFTVMNAVTDQSAHAARINLYTSPLPTTKITAQTVSLHIYLQQLQLQLYGGKLVLHIFWMCTGNVYVSKCFFAQKSEQKKMYCCKCVYTFSRAVMHLMISHIYR